MPHKQRLVYTDIQQYTEGTLGMLGNLYNMAKNSSNHRDKCIISVVATLGHHQFYVTLYFHCYVC